MKLYLDTNTFLAYISPTSDIKSLEKLKKLIADNAVELVLPSQTKAEFLRHFKDKVLQAKKKLKDNQFLGKIKKEIGNQKKDTLMVPDKTIFKKVDSLIEEIGRIRKQQTLELEKHLKIVEKLLGEIFKLSVFYEYTDDTILKAVIRYAKDLPPKKNDHKFGDAIIWESLKENIKREELIIVTTDPDFYQNKNIKKGRANSLLVSEWKKHSGGKRLTLYTALGRFVNTLDKQNKVSKETIERETIQAAVLTNLSQGNAMGTATFVAGANGSAVTLGGMLSSASVSPLSGDYVGTAGASILSGSRVGSVLSFGDGLTALNEKRLICTICKVGFTYVPSNFGVATGIGRQIVYCPNGHANAVS